MRISVPNAIRQRIIDCMNEQGLIEYELALRSGLTPSTLNSFMNRNLSCTISTLSKIISGLNMTYASFFSSPIFDRTLAETDLLDDKD